MKLENRNGLSVTLLEMGGAIQSILMPDRNGRLLDIVLGYDDPAAYPGGSCFGAFVGRFANRIGKGEFPLNGRTVHVTVNEGVNSLHGGHGYHLRPWKLEKSASGALLSLHDPDGEEGFPGNVDVQVEVTLTEDNELIFDYRATTDADTVINLTNHSFFNLSGAETILDHELMIASDAYLEVDSGLIPTGKLIDVTGTDFDFRTRRPILNGKYDHCYVLRPGGVQAEVYDPVSGRGMRMETDLPGVQLYCGGGLGGAPGRGGIRHKANAGLCLETQQFPDAPNKPGFPSALLRAGETMTSRTKYTFFVD